jgi:hypothetical protein
MAIPIKFGVAQFSRIWERNMPFKNWFSGQLERSAASKPTKKKRDSLPRLK